MEATIAIAVWPDDIWCFYEDHEMEEHLSWLSDDYEIRHLTHQELDALY